MRDVGSSSRATAALVDLLALARMELQILEAVVAAQALMAPQKMAAMVEAD